MNIFSRLLMDDAARLGNPLGVGTGPFLMRMNQMAARTRGNGFREPPKGPKLSRNGTTRKQREAGNRAMFEKNLKAEVEFRARHAGKPGWCIAQINRAIERREHLKPSKGK